MIDILAKTALPVLLTGETGSGKSYLAKKIHQKSPFANGPFLAVNLTALARELVESELFGHEQGAFTGALKSRRGFFEQATGGTLFIDEIGEVDEGLQKKLLLVLENQEFRPVGSERVQKLRCKLIFATNKCLQKEVINQTFRSDLYYRIAGFTYRLPSLKEEISKDPHFITKFYEELDAPHFLSPPIAEECLHWMNQRSWPGNLRQLKMALKSSLDLLGPQDKCIDLETMKATIAACELGASSEKSSQGYILGTLKNYHEAVADFERSYFESALKAYNGRINLISRSLSVNKTTLLAKLRRYDLKAKRYKTDSLQLVQAYS